MKGKLLSIFSVILLFSAVFAQSASYSFHVIPIEYRVYPGELTKLTVLITNDANLNNFYINITNPEFSTDFMKSLLTVYNVRAEIYNESGYTIPFEVLSANPTYVGTLLPGIPGKAIFLIKVKDNISDGIYTIPLRLYYTHMKISEIPNTTLASVSYVNSETTVYFTIKVTKKFYDLKVTSNSTLYNGTIGNVTIRVTNTGEFKLSNLTLILNSTPPIVPIPTGFIKYVGNLDPGKSANVSFKVRVLNSARKGVYPVTIIAKFLDSSGKPIVIPKVIGVRVKTSGLVKIIERECYIPIYIKIPSTISGLPQINSPGSLPGVPPASMSKASVPQPILSTNLQQVSPIGYVRFCIVPKVAMDDASVVLSLKNPLITPLNNVYLGDVSKNSIKCFVFYIKNQAPVGTYPAKLIFTYKKENTENYIEIPVKITVGISSLEIKNVESLDLNPGGTGTVKIILSGNANNISCNLMDSSVIQSITQSVFTENTQHPIEFMVNVNDKALPTHYELYLVCNYDTKYAKNLITVFKVPVKVSEKYTMIKVVRVVSEDLHPDSTGYVYVYIKNKGNITMHNSIVELSVQQPLSIAGESSIGSMLGISQPGSYYVGDILPNKEVVAVFKVKVDKHAAPGYYPVKVKVVYYDSKGYEHKTDEYVIGVHVTSSKIPLYVILGVLLSLVGISLGAYYIKSRKKKNA